MSFDSFPHAAGGDINTSRFVKISTAADNTVLEADANEQICGVSSEAAQDAPIPGASALAAVSGDSVSVHPIGSIACVLVGSGGVTRGANVKSDADGKAVLAATTGTTVQWIAGTALETAAAGELAKILVQSFAHRPALS